MEFLASWVILALIVGYIAGQRGRSGVGFFLLSVLLSPLIGILVLLATPGRPSSPMAQAEPRAPCWQCREQVVVGASKCRFCGAGLAWPNESSTGVSE